jgi:COP9 signalosome complex subunit 3
MVQYPKYTAGVVTRVVERNAKEYVKLAEAFIREDWKTVRGCVGVKEFKDVS